jgi:hypothetical protein
LNADSGNHPVKKFSSFTDERAALFIFFHSWTFAYKNQGRLRVPFTIDQSVPF